MYLVNVSSHMYIPVAVVDKYHLQTLSLQIRILCNSSEVQLIQPKVINVLYTHKGIHYQNDVCTTCTVHVKKGCQINGMQVRTSGYWMSTKTHHAIATAMVRTNVHWKIMFIINFCSLNWLIKTGWLIKNLTMPSHVGQNGYIWIHFFQEQHEWTICY